MTNLTNTVKGVVTQLLGVLTPRNRDAVSRRFGLKTGKKETLESIGKGYGITRERVRQIEEASLRQIKEQFNSGLGTKVKPFVNLAENILDQAGGVIREDHLFEKFSGNSKNSPANAALIFFLTLDKKFQRFSETNDFYTFWSLSSQHADSFKKSISAFVSSLDKKATPIAETTVADFYQKSGASLKYTSVASVMSYLSISKNISKNTFGQVGLTSWPEIKPRGVKDKAFLVLKRDGTPKHFRDITKMINEASFSSRKANAQTVHNELIKDGRFVLVGRGMYGLSEWGLKAGTVKDVLVDLLKTANEPLHKDDIVASVLSHRLVKENTILLNLQDPDTFEKRDDGKYSLREA
ncbi:MAG: sigma factor-like helix-turn-helix DNA-binding protein [Candidatus Paceibacterota bacterium]